VAAWVLLRKPAEPPAARPADETAQAAPPAPAAEGPVAPVPDTEARAQLQGVGKDPSFLGWLANADDLVRRWAIVTDNLDHGESPRKALEGAGPKEPFQVVRSGGKTVIAPAAYARFDKFAAAVDSIDAHAFAAVYAKLHPALEAAYRALGYPGGSLDAATLRALRRLEAAPVAEGDVELEHQRGIYLFADPKLEGLRQVEKHLLRMGPKNERLIQAKAKQVREALGLGPEPAGQK
jgi:hypothetical protein